MYWCLLGLCFLSIQTAAQELPVSEALKTVPNAKCYWSYSVERLTSKQKTFFNYSIRVGITQIDSSGRPAGSLRLQHVVIYCKFIDKHISRKVYCKQVGYSWVAKFKIHTSQPLPVEIVASYRDDQRIMALTLNKGNYPGEDDNAEEELP